MQGTSWAQGMVSDQGAMGMPGTALSHVELTIMVLGGLEGATSS